MTAPPKDHAGRIGYELQGFGEHEGGGGWTTRRVKPKRAGRVHEPDGPLRDERDDLADEPDGVGRSLRALDRPRASAASGDGAGARHRQQREPDVRRAGGHGLQAPERLAAIARDYGIEDL